MSGSYKSPAASSSSSSKKSGSSSSSKRSGSSSSSKRSGSSSSSSKRSGSSSSSSKSASKSYSAPTPKFYAGLSQMTLEDLKKIARRHPNEIKSFSKLKKSSLISKIRRNLNIPYENPKKKRYVKDSTPESMTGFKELDKESLLEIARTHGVTKYSHLKRDELVRKISRKLSKKKASSPKKSSKKSPKKSSKKSTPKKTIELKEYTVVEMKELAKRKKIPGYSALKRSQLVRKLSAALPLKVAKPRTKSYRKGHTPAAFAGFKEMNKEALVKVARSHGIENYSKLTKDQLVRKVSRKLSKKK